MIDLTKIESLCNKFDEAMTLSDQDYANELAHEIVELIIESELIDELRELRAKVAHLQQRSVK